MINYIKPIGALALAVLFAAMALPVGASGCDDTVRALNQRLQIKIDEAELTDALKALNTSNNARLPDKFVVKREAQRLGWQPGRDLWSIPALKSKSIGGDRFGNREGRLPNGNWREADLDYRGGHRGAKRLLFSADGRRRVTVDHYRTFVEIPECR
ncbi:MAG: ribonuclease domain-containing protein [Sulfuricellaceae bacterium]